MDIVNKALKLQEKLELNDRIAIASGTLEDFDQYIHIKDRKMNNNDMTNLRSLLTTTFQLRDGTSYNIIDFVAACEKDALLEIKEFHRKKSVSELRKSSLLYPLLNSKFKVSL